VETTRLTVHPAFTVGRVEPTLFGGFLEHMGRCVYEGVFDPASAHADEHGCRTDVLAALAELRLSVMRYPGGNFASGYHWRDGVGPVDQRPTVRELAWQSIEPNRFGTDEFLALCGRTGWEPMLAVNLGTGTPEEARDWVEYCNAPAGTRVADQRVANGHPDPYGVRLWCLGNEMDGPWQLGHVPARDYAIRAQQAAKLMKDLDPAVRTVACGSSATTMPTFAEWDREVLRYLGSDADYISLHRYVDNHAGDTPDFLAVGASIDRQIEDIDAVCRTVRAETRGRSRAYLCFDEWNVWYKNLEMDGAGRFAPHLIEEIYNLEDALVVAQFLNSFVRHADVVKIANLAQVVNVIAPLLTRGDDLLVQTIFHPQRMMATRRDGIALRIATDGPDYEGRRNGRVPYIDASAILDDRRLHVFCVNRSTDAAAPVSLAVPGTTLGPTVAAELLTGPDAKAANTFDTPGVIRPESFTEVDVDGPTATFELPPLSFAALTFDLG
jgi:alpha-N-arabinofuranosidase